MSDEKLNNAENTRREHLKNWLFISCAVSSVAILGLTAVMWIHGSGWSRSARHGWQDFFMLVLGCSMGWQLMLIQKVDWKATPSPLSTLDLSQQSEGRVKAARSDHWNDEGSSEAR